jgi:acyl-CoA reductase-like NAD-dependent aldehyde dehydrogenase
MTIDIRHGSPQFPGVAGNIQPSTHEEMDDAVQTVRSHKDEWVQVPISKRIAMLDQMIKSFTAIAPRWVAAGMKAKDIAADSDAVSEEWAADTYPILKNLRQLRQSLIDIQAYGRPRIPGPVTTRPNGQVVAQVFPQDGYDRLFFSGVTIEIWMEPDVTVANLPQTQGMIYRNKPHEGKVALILGAGNVGSIGPADIFYKLFSEDQVVVFKTSPVNAYLGPLMAEAFRALVEPGFLRIVDGGPTEGAYLCNHPGVDEIHCTGSDKTFEAIVFGSGPEGTVRKANNQSMLKKRVTSELGNVSPVIIVPGPWSESDLAYQAEHVATTFVSNAGFHCLSSRVIIQHSAWPLREQFLQQMRKTLAQVPLRDAYYPGAKDRHRTFLAAHPDAEQFGTPTGEELPWTLVTGVDSRNKDDVCFTTEAFCGLCAETTIDGTNAAEYLDRAVDFANAHLWGTLSAIILIHPASLKDPAVAAAFDRALTNLRYGTIGVNYPAALGFVLMVPTWGAFPGHTINDIQSGTGVVHNTLLFEHPQKSIIRAPFHIRPTPPWFVLHTNTGRKLYPKMVQFEATPSLWKLPSLMWTAITG